MKSEHRHKLETNWLAKRLNVVVERLRPYASTIVGVIVAIVVVMFLWLYLSGSSSARQSEAWDVYNQAVTESVPDVEQLRQAAQEHPGTKMQQLADITWADSQVLRAARDYIYNRPAAMEALTKAMSAYQAVIQSSNDDRLVNRARLGVARAYEIQGKLDAARKAYQDVKGAFEPYAKRQAERLAEPEAKDTYAWLATARPRLPQAPMGPGTPGVQPDFSPGELALPGAPSGTTSPEASPAQTQSIEDLLKGLEIDFNAPTGSDRYAPAGEAAPQEGSPSKTTSDDTPATPTDSQSSPPSNTTPTNGAATSDNAPTEPTSISGESDDAPK